jgi:hypothetical protein
VCSQERLAKGKDKGRSSEMVNECNCGNRKKKKKQKAF